MVPREERSTSSHTEGPGDHRSARSLQAALRLARPQSVVSDTGTHSREGLPLRPAAARPPGSSTSFSARPSEGSRALLQPETTEVSLFKGF